MTKQVNVKLPFAFAITGLLFLLLFLLLLLANVALEWIGFQRLVREGEHADLAALANLMFIRFVVHNIAMAVLGIAIGLVSIAVMVTLVRIRT